MYVFTRPYRQFNTGDPAPTEYDPGVTGTLVARGVLAPAAEPEPDQLPPFVPKNKAIASGQKVKVKSWSKRVKVK